MTVNTSNRSRTVVSCGLFALYVVAVCSPLLIALLARPRTDHGLVSELAKNCGLLGIGLLAMQFVLPTRMRPVTRVFGLDSVMIFHRSMGLFALALLLIHPLLLAIGEANWKLLYGLKLPWYIWAGKVTLLLLLTHVLISVFRCALRLSFERWRVAHDVLAVSILGLALTHSWFAGGDLQAWPMRVLWSVLGGAALLAFIWHRLIRPRRLAARPYRVAEVRQESPDVWTLRFELPTGQTPRHLPGQFHFVTFPNSSAVPAEEHHFTISSSPTEHGYVESTIKASGDFTRRIGEIRPGETATVHGSFGRFSYVLHRDESELVFIAGGIGITPLMSMLRHLRDTESQRPVTLLYANKTEEDIVFRDELAEMQAARQPPLRVVHVISRSDESCREERGHIDEEKLGRLLGEDLTGKGFYVCGPAALTKQVVAALRQQKVPLHCIHAESFSLLEDTAPTSSRSVQRKRATVVTVFVTLLLVVAVATMRYGGTSSPVGHGHSGGHGHGEPSPSESPHAEPSHSHTDH